MSRGMSRGATGDQSRRTKIYEFLKKNETQRRSVDWNIIL